MSLASIRKCVAYELPNRNKALRLCQLLKGQIVMEFCMENLPVSAANYADLFRVGAGHFFLGDGAIIKGESTSERSC